MREAGEVRAVRGRLRDEKLPEGEGILRELWQSTSSMTEEGMYYISGVLHRPSEQEDRTVRAGDTYTHSGTSESNRYTGTPL